MHFLARERRTFRSDDVRWRSQRRKSRTVCVDLGADFVSRLEFLPSL
jgi:hypothetical protein